MRAPFITLAWLLCLSGAACIVEAPGGEKSAAPARSRVVVSQVPPLQVQTGANLEGKVEIVGASIQPGRVAPGESFKVTLFLKVLAEMEVDYMVFVHADDPDGKSDRLNADHKPAGGGYPTTQWKAGETIKDEFSVYVPPMAGRGLNLYLGFWDPKTDARLKLSNPEKVRSDGNNRILIAQVPVGQ